MPEWWRACAFTQNEAADLSGLRGSTLRDWVSTTGKLFVSERRNGQRWYSPEDILVLRIANELIRGGFVMILALAIAKDHVEGAHWFPPEALLVAKPGSTSTTAVRLCFSVEEAPDWASLQIIRFGQIAHETLQACEAQL